MDKTKILVVDDHQIVIEGIKSALQEYAEFELVGDAAACFRVWNLQCL